jgi:hypothetical protein
MTKADDAETVKALLYERTGYEARLAVAKEANADEEVAVQKENIAAVNKSLKAHGHEAAAPAKRAETRPAKAAEKR